MKLINQVLCFAARLFSVGIDVAREQLRKLVEQGVLYDSSEMRKALNDYQELECKWKALELEHLHHST